MKNWNDRLDSVLQDVAFSMRQLRRSPGFAVTTIITLALGIGANATMFGIVDRLLLQPPAQVVDPARVVTASVAIGTTRHLQQQLSYRIYRDLERATDAFADVGAFEYATIPVRPEATIIPVVKATAGYFRALGVRPALGRFFTDDESEPDPGAHVIVLGYAYWQQHFAGDGSIVGRTVAVSGAPFTVIGIAPPGFVGLDLGEVSAWIPYPIGAPPAELSHWRVNRQWYTLGVVARLRPGIGLDAANARGTARLLAGESEDGYSPNQIRQRDEQLRLTSALPRDARGSRPESKVAVLVAAVSFLVLIIACANVANLQLARAMGRRREVAVRLALGVSFGRLLRQFALDGLLLGLLGGGVALAIVLASEGLAGHVLLSGAIAQGSAVSWRVVAFTATAAVVTGFVTGLAPALQSARGDVSRVLRGGGRGSIGDSGSSSPARFALIALQAAFTVVLLFGTVLFALSLERVQAVPLGMDPTHVLLVRINTNGGAIPPRDLALDYQRLELAAKSLPEVTSAAVSNMIPLGSTMTVELTLPGRDSVPVTAAGGPYYYAVGPAYFRTMAIPMVIGESFTQADRAGTTPVVIVNQTAAKLWWPNERPIGKCVHVGGDSTPCAMVIGVAGDTRRRAIVEDAAAMVYTPIGQGPALPTPNVLLLRTRRPSAEVSAVIATGLRAATPGVPAAATRPLSDSLDPQMHSWKLGATMFGLFALLAIVLAAVGLYGVMAYDVAARTTEIGVRMALGARGADIGRLVLRRGVRVLSAGGLSGIVIALVAGSRVGPLLFRTAPYEPVAFGVAVAVLAGVSVGATLIPAMRAASVAPSESLRAG